MMLQTLVELRGLILFAAVGQALPVAVSAWHELRGSKPTITLSTTGSHTSLAFLLFMLWWHLGDVQTAMAAIEAGATP